MKTIRIRDLLLPLMAGLFLGAAFLGAGCGSSSPSTPSPDGGTATCFSGTPTTHLQLINACTPDFVTKIDKVSTAPRGKANLPSLP